MADLTIPLDPTSIDHGGLLGLADDDHTQYLLLAGRAGGQTAIGGTAISEILNLQGSSHANRGQIFTRGRVQLDYDWTTDSGSNALTWSNTIPSSGGVVSFMIAMSNTVTVDSGTFIPGAFRDVSAMEWTTAPGFAVVTLFLSQPRLFSTTPGVAPAQTIVFAAQPTYESFGAGAITSTSFRGASANVILRARNAGDNMTLTNNHGLFFSGLWNTNNATAIVDFGNSAAVKVGNPTTVLFGQALGTERCVNWYGIDYDNITLATTGERAVVHSSLVASGINFFLKNDGGADSDHGAGDLHLDDNAAVTFGGTLAAPDVRILWDSAAGALAFDPVTGGDLLFDLFAADQYVISAENFGNDVSALRLGFDRFVMGGTGAIGNQVINFVAPANRMVSIPGGWSDFLLTQAGPVDLDGNAMSQVFGWTINAPNLTLNGGSAVDAGALLIGGNSDNATNRYGLLILSNPSGGGGENEALRVRTGRTRVEDFYHDGTNLGFYGTTPVAQGAAWTVTNVTTDRTYDADSTNLNELADVLGTLIAELQANGMLA